MATLSNRSVHAKSYLVMGIGEPYGEPGRKELQSVDRIADRFRPEDVSEHNASGFDTGSLRNSFDTAAEAEAFRRQLADGALIINPFRVIDPAALAVHELQLDIYGVDLTDNEYETITVMGALDSIPGPERQIFLRGFPALSKLTIDEPFVPPASTIDGNDAYILHASYRHIRPDRMAMFNAIASGDAGALPADHTQSFAGRLRNNILGASFYRSMTDVAEEAGKSLIGFDDLNADILFTRLYDVNHTIAPKRQPGEMDRLMAALQVLDGQKPAVVRTIVDALKARGLDPRRSRSLPAPGGAG